MKAGYGSLNEVREFDAKTVIETLNYEKFLGDYEEAFLELNRGD